MTELDRQLETILDIFEADLKVATAYTPKVLAKTRLKTLINEQVIAELELIMLRRESGGRTGIRNRVRDRINQLKDKQGKL